MHIYSPSYNGNHNLKQYVKMVLDLEELMLEIGTAKEIYVNMDFLHDKEIDHYFNKVFAHVAILLGIRFVVISKDKKKLRKIKKILKEHMFVLGTIKMRKGKYYVKINA